MQLNKDLCELEGCVTAHVAAIPELRNDVKGVITQVTKLISKASSVQASGVSLNVSMAGLGRRLPKVQKHTDNSLKGLE